MTARAHEHEPRRRGSRSLANRIAHIDAPGAVAQLLEARHCLLEPQLRAAVCQVLREISRQSAEVHIGTGCDVGCSDRLALLPARDEQRRPLADDGGILAVLHAGEKRVILESLETLPEVGDVLLSPDETHVRSRIDERARIRQRTQLNEVRPELPGNLELLVHLDRTRDVDRSVGALRGVVQLTESGVAGARVVPRVRALEGDISEPLEDLDAPVRLQLLQQGAEGCAHDPAANQGNVNGFAHALSLVAGERCVGRPQSPRSRNCSFIRRAISA